MAPYNPMKKHMEKLDEWGASQSKKLAATRDAGPGASISDRFNLARGKDDRWEKSKASRANEDDTNIVPQRSNRADRLPQAPSSFVGGKSPPPPPPQRGLSSGSSSNVPPPPARGKAPPPPLPRRMDNESGIDRPPPDYGTSLATASSTQHDYIEFSKFTEEDKQAFFSLLDEFFASRYRVGASAGKSSLRNDRRLPFADDTPSVQMTTTKEPSKPNGPGAKASIFTSSTGSTSSSYPAAAASSSSSFSYPRLSTSSLDASELCTALTCSTFLCYPESYPEWNGPQPWFVMPSPVPSSIKGRRDVTYSMSSMYRGNDHTLFGGALFADLSCLWWEISWNSTNPSKTVKRQVAYREPPGSWNDEERLVEASRGFGDWIAGFAEINERNRTPVGDGECWTLAAEAIQYTNQTAGLNESNRLMKTIGRTHGYLLFAGKADEVKGQCGRWRGGDLGIRRGDIVEWKTAKCKVKGGPPGSYVTLGAPEHTAIIVEDSPVIKRLEQMKSKLNRGKDYYSILGVGRMASQAEIRAAYLQGARKHHPDKQNGEGDNLIQRLNEAHATLSDSTLRTKYDQQLRGQGSSTNTSRVTSEVDLDSFEVMESPESSSVMSFYYPCRCGNGFYIDENQLQNGQDIISCSGCSEQIRVIWQDKQTDPVLAEATSKEEDDEDDQPSLSPWELGWITTIEQSAGKAPSRCTYDLSQDSFTRGDIWIYRPVWEVEYLGGPVTASWPPSLPGWEQLA